MQKAKMLRGPAVASLAALALAACTEGLSGTMLETQALNTPAMVPGLPAGFECPLVPNGFDPAGSIYRLDKSNTYYRVKDYSKDPVIGALPNFKSNVKISNYVFSDRQKSNAGLSMAMLKTALPGLAGGSADFNKEMQLDITVEDMVGEVIDDTVADKIVDDFKANVTPKAGSKYFLVRETVRAGAVSYRVRQADLAKIGGKAEIEKLASAKANVTVKDNEGAFEIKQTFAPDRITVCIKSAEIVVEPKRGDGSVASVSLKSVSDTTVPTIKRVGEN